LAFLAAQFRSFLECRIGNAKERLSSPFRRSLKADPANHNRIAQSLSAENGWFWANQLDNTANRRAHFITTGPKIWDQTMGEVSAFVASIETGATLLGTGLYHKENAGKKLHVSAPTLTALIASG
jgi:cysteine synthase